MNLCDSLGCPQHLWHKCIQTGEEKDSRGDIQLLTFNATINIQKDHVLTYLGPDLSASVCKKLMGINSDNCLIMLTWQVHSSFSISSFDSYFIDNHLSLHPYGDSIPAKVWIEYSWIDIYTFTAERGVWEICIFRGITDETKSALSWGDIFSPVLSSGPNTQGFLSDCSSK